MRSKNKLLVWESEKYIDRASHGSGDLKHPGMLILKNLAKNAENILDLGCGDGTRLEYLVHGGNGTGIDISKSAINRARRIYPGLKFLNADLRKLSFKSNSFELVYSAFVLEHLTSVEKVIEEAIRVAKSDGFIVFIAPNYGAPNRASPSFSGSRIRKFFTGYIFDMIDTIAEKRNRLRWNKVRPLTEKISYESDFDTTVEPYIRTLISFLTFKGLNIVNWTTCWNQELGNSKIYQKVFRFLGEKGFYPYKYWGPHLVVVAKK